MDNKDLAFQVDNVSKIYRLGAENIAKDSLGNSSIYKITISTSMISLILYATSPSLALIKFISRKKATM